MRSKLRASIQSWNEVLIIPQRMMPVLDDTIGGNVIKASSLLRALIIRKCLLDIGNIGHNFPFICAEQDLTLQDESSFFVHVV